VGTRSPQLGDFTDAARVLGRARQARDAELAVRLAAAHEASRARSAPAFVWPAPGVLTGWFAEPRGARAHPGIDIDGETGDPVVATATGRVVVAGPAPAGFSGYGLLVIVDHGNGLVSLYAHLSKVDVALGAAVRQGQLLGAVGSTGASTGSHLHFELRRNGVPVDPRAVLPGRPG
jgi:murein DD-endopeptidase MepM/ murein hydrolase activator NlpD